MKTETLHVTETEERILNAALKVVNDVTISGTRQGRYGAVKCSLLL